MWLHVKLNKNVIKRYYKILIEDVFYQYFNYDLKSFKAG